MQSLKTLVYISLANKNVLKSSWKTFNKGYLRLDTNLAHNKMVKVFKTHIDIKQHTISHQVKAST